MDISILRAELKEIDVKRQAILNLISVYENGAVEVKKEKKPLTRKRKTNGPTFHDQVVELARKVANGNATHVKVKQVLDLARQNGVVDGKDANRDLQRIASILVVEKKKGTLDRIDKGHYQFINGNRS